MNSARKNNNPQLCIRLSLSTLKEDPYNELALRNLAWGYFATGEYSEAIDSVKGMMRLREHYPPRVRKGVKKTERACRLLLRLAQRRNQKGELQKKKESYFEAIFTMLEKKEVALLPPSEGVQYWVNLWAGSLSKEEVYLRHLNAQRAAVGMKSVLTEDDLLVTCGEGGEGLGWNEVAILSPTNDNLDWSETELQGDGGERNVPSSVLADFPNAQGTGGSIYSKNRIVNFNCRNFLTSSKKTHLCYRGKGICARCLRQNFPIPAYRWPSLNCDLDRGRLVIPDEHLDVFISHSSVPRGVLGQIRSLLDALGKKKSHTPAPKYQNIIDPNVASVNNTWIPTEFDICVRKIPSSDLCVLIELACREVRFG